jgi:hypothetical protein
LLAKSARQPIENPGNFFSDLIEIQR